MASRCRCVKHSRPALYATKAACRFSIEMKDGKYEFGEKFKDAKSSGMLDSNMGRVPVHRHVENVARHTG